MSIDRRNPTDLDSVSDDVQNTEIKIKIDTDVINELASESITIDDIVTGIETGEMAINEDGSGIARIHDEVAILKEEIIPVFTSPDVTENKDHQDTSQATEFTVPARPKNEHVIQEQEVVLPLKATDKVDEIAFFLPTESSTVIQESLMSLPNEQVGNNEETQRWLNGIRNSQYTVPVGNTFDDISKREDSEWRQTIPSEKGNLGPAGVKFSDSISTKLTGERAVMRVRALTGLGDTIIYPMWHSGFWVSIKAPTNAALLELNRKIGEEKISLGRMSHGLAYANNSVFFAASVIDFALAHIYDTTLRPEMVSEIRSKMSIFDIPLLITALARTIWPSGFLYSASILDQATKQNKTISERLNLGKINWTDYRSLTPWQIGQMSIRHGNGVTQETLDRYRNDFTRGKGRSINISDELKINLRVPNVEQYLNSGYKWVNNIVSMVDRAFGIDQDETIRNVYITDQGKAVNMRQYCHFVESIEVGNSIIEDQETIEQTLDVLSADENIRNKYFEEVKKFEEDSTISIIGIPVLEKEDRSTLPRFPHLIPLDVLSVFFIQLVLRVTEIQAQE